MSAPILNVKSLQAGYGQTMVIRGVDLIVHEGEIAAVLGHNGSGKTTLLRCLAGLKRPTAGEVLVDPGVGKAVVHAVPQTSIGVLRQGKAIFRSLTVEENLVICTSSFPAAQRVPRARAHLREIGIFAGRARSHGHTLSGGAQRLLGLSMVLLREPRLLLLDEPSTGLATHMMTRMFTEIQEWAKIRRAAIVIVEQKVRAALSIADTAYVLRQGIWSFHGPARNLTPEVLRDVFL